ncbi:MAG: hypothetical protein AAF674_05270 [Pseudomonadota bacterium]
MAATSSTDQDMAELVVPAELSPADAEDVRAEALEKLKAAQEGGTPLAIALDGSRAAPCAIQILVATKHSARGAGVPVVFAAETTQVLDSLGLEIGSDR